jgi:hypothetical protein
MEKRQREKRGRRGGEERRTRAIREWEQEEEEK